MSSTGQTVLSTSNLIDEFYPTRKHAQGYSLTAVWQFSITWASIANTWKTRHISIASSHILGGLHRSKSSKSLPVAACRFPDGKTLRNLSKQSILTSVQTTRALSMSPSSNTDPSQGSICMKRKDCAHQPTDAFSRKLAAQAEILRRRCI